MYVCVLGVHACVRKRTRIEILTSANIIRSVNFIVKYTQMSGDN